MKTYVQRKLIHKMFMAALFMIAKSGNNPSIDRWLNKMWCTHTIDCYLAIKGTKS